MILALLAKRSILLGLGIFAVLMQPVLSADNSCEIPAPVDQPAAGDWTGTFKFVFQPTVPGIPTPSLIYTWEGPLTYELVRPTRDEAVTPSAARSRRPLLVPGTKPTVPPGWAAPGQFKNDEEQAQAILAWYRDHVPPEPSIGSPNSTIQGKIKTQWHAQFEDFSDGSSAEATADSARDLTVEERGEEAPGPPPRFKTIDLINQGDPFLHTATALVSDSSGQTNANETPDQTVITDSRGQRITTPSVGQGPTSKGKTAELNVYEFNCAEMSGKVAFTDEILRAAMGIEYKTVSSEWNTRLDKRDEEFERRVAELAAEPIPADLDQAYVDHFKDAWYQLRGPGRLTDYRRCVLKKLENKLVKIDAAVLRILLDNFPKAEYGASCVVFNASILRILPIVRLLQLYGASPENCPLADEWTEVAGREIRAALKTLLGRPHTLSELTCYVALSRQGVVDLGELADQLQQDLWGLYQASAGPGS